jgi:signal transduction histidine kinase
MNFLVNDILDLSLIKSNNFRKNLTIFDLKECIQEIIQIYMFKSSQKSITINTNFKKFSSNKNDINQ